MRAADRKYPRSVSRKKLLQNAAQVGLNIVNSGNSTPNSIKHQIRNALYANRDFSSSNSNFSINSQRQNILIKFPTRSRPEKFFTTLRRWIEFLSGKHNVRFLITLDSDDKTMNNDEVLEKLRVLPNVTYQISDSQNKVEAINHGMTGQEFDILILASDDMIPQVSGYDEIIARDMQTHFPNRDGALHYNDGFRRQDLCTLNIMGYNLYRKFGYIYNPEYKSLWCDNEYTDVVRKIGKYVYSDHSIIRHEHPANTRISPPDGLLTKNDSYFHRDQAVYFKRRENNFDIKKPKLSILIPSLVTRQDTLNRLLISLNAQINSLNNLFDVEIRIFLDDRKHTVGFKRNKLLQEALGEYTVFIDDDDSVADNYVTDILNAIKNNPDCVVFKGVLTTDGKSPKEFWFSKEYAGRQDGDVYYRTPNHLCPTKASIAKSKSFPEINFGEDYGWANAIFSQLKVEQKIDKVLYYYQLTNGMKR